MISNLREDQQHRHPLGFGWVAETASVAPTCYIAPHAIVYGAAVLTGRVKVLDFAQVSGKTKLSGKVVVSGNYWLDHGEYSGNEHFHNNARVQEKQTRIR